MIFPSYLFDGRIIIISAEVNTDKNYCGRR